jgi:hypothetical protein
MNVTVEHIVIAVVALTLIYTIVQHGNVNLIEPNIGETLLKGVSFFAPVADLVPAAVNIIEKPPNRLICNNMNRIQKQTNHSDERKTTFKFNDESKTIPYRSTYIPLESDEECSQIFIDPNANNMTPELANATCESICIKGGTKCTLESKTPGTYGAGFGYFKKDGSWIVDRFNKSNPDYVHEGARDPYPKKIQAYRCKNTNTVCYDCPDN